MSQRATGRGIDNEAANDANTIELADDGVFGHVFFAGNDGAALMIRLIGCQLRRRFDVLPATRSFDFRFRVWIEFDAVVGTVRSICIRPAAALGGSSSTDQNSMLNAR
jgi:hypothetical protein